MATVLVRFDGGDVPVVTGGVPPDDKTRIEFPTATGFVTNQAFIVDAGEYCFGLETTRNYMPPWKVVQAIDGEQTTVTFRTIP
jgi:hypothetical protein